MNRNQGTFFTKIFSYFGQSQIDFFSQ
jgi:hypothetical protein